MNPSSIIRSDGPIYGDLDAVRHHWRWVLASGIAFVGLGSMAFAYSVLVTLASVFVLGWALVFGGLFQAIHAFKVSRWSGFFLELVMAILYVIVGLVMVAHPGAGAMSVTLLIAAFFLVGGLSRIFAGTMLHLPGRAWLLVSGAVTLLLGLLILMEWPASGLWIIGTFVAIDMIFSGAWLIMLALNARSLSPSGAHGRPTVQPTMTFEVQPNQP
ncbi:MAG: HdeD family acid-resistance protein [Nitrospirota bacterium]